MFRNRSFSVIGLACALTTVFLTTSCSKFGFMGIDSQGQQAALNSSGPGPALALSIAGPAAITSGICSSLFTVTGIDANSGPSEAFPQGTMVALSGLDTNTVFLDPSCTIPAVGNFVPVTAGSNQAPFYLKGKSSGTKLLRATVDTLPSTIVPVMVQAGDPTSIVISFPSSINNNQCTSGSVALFDINLNATAALSDVTTALTSNVNNGTGFYSDATCDTPISSATILRGATSRTIYIFAPAATTNLIVFAGSSGGILGSNKSITVGNVNTPKLVLTTPNTAVVAGTCVSGQVDSKFANNTPYKVRLDTDVLLTPNLASTLFFSDAACSSAIANRTVRITNLTSSKGFYFKVTQADMTLNLEATATGFTAGTSSNAVTAAAPSQLVLSGVPASIPANRCSTAIQVGLRDPFGNIAKAAAATPVMVNFLGDQLTFFTANDCGGTGTTTVTINNAASSTTFYFKARNPGSARIEAKVTGLTTATSSSIEIKNAQEIPFVVRLSTVPANSTTIAGNCLPLSLSSFDMNNFPVDVFPQDINFTLSTTGSQAAVFFSDSSCAANTNITSIALVKDTHESVLYFKTTVVGPQPPLLSAVSTNPSLTATLPLTVLPAEPAQLVINGSLNSVPAATCNGLTVIAKDRFDNPSVPAQDLRVTFPMVQFVTYYSDAQCSNPVTELTLANSSSLMFYFRVQSVGNAAPVNRVTLVAAGPTGVAAGTKVVSVDPPTSIHVVFTAPANIPAGQCQEITVTALDPNNQPLIREALTIPVSAGGQTNVLFSNSGCTTALSPASVTLSQGNNPRSFWLKLTTAGPVILTGTSAAVGNATLEVTIQPLAPSRLVFVPTTGPSTLDANVCTGPYSVESRDTHGNLSPVSATTPLTIAFNGGATGGIFADANCASANPSLTGGQSQRSFYLKISGPQAVTATLTVGSLFDSRAFTIRPPATIRFVVNGQTIDSLNFGEITLGSSSNPIEVELENSSGTQPILLNTLTLTGEFSTQGGSCGSGNTSIPANGSCTVNLIFTPPSDSAASGNLRAAFTVGGLAYASNLALTGTGKRAQTAMVAAAPTTLSFGDVFVGETKKMDVVLTNTGLQRATSITGVGQGDLSFESVCGSLDPNAQCTIKVVLAPSAPGNLTQSLTLTYNDGNGNRTITLAVSAVLKTPALLSYNLSSVDFGNVPILDTKTLNVTVQNRGALEAANVGYQVLGSSFSLGQGNCGPRIAAGASCTVALNFRPTARATFPGNLLIQYESAGHPQIANREISLPLTGVGFAKAQLAFTPVSLSFPETLVDSFRTLPIRVENVGDRRADTIEVVQATSDIFLVDYGTNCPAALNPGQFCAINVVFSPKVRGNATHSFTLAFKDQGDPQSSPSVALSGIGQSAAAVAFSPTTNDLGSVVVGATSVAKRFTVRNNGDDNAISVILSGPPENSPFDVLDSNCPAFNVASTLAAGASCQFSVVFRPTAVGALQQGFAVSYRSSLGGSTRNASAQAQAVGISPSSLVVDSSIVDFGRPLKGTTPDPERLSFTNRGPARIPSVDLGTIPAPFFVSGGTCGASPFALEAGATCSVEFRAATTTAGDNNRTLNVRFNNGAAVVAGPQITLAMFVGNAGTLVGPVSFNIVDTRVGTTRNAILNLTNGGDYDLRINNFDLLAPFAGTLSGCAGVIAPHANCQFSIAFTPLTSSDNRANLVLNASDTNNIQTRLSIIITGRGYTAGYVTTPPLLDFGSVFMGSNKEMALMVKNDGDTPIDTISGVVGSDPSFVVASNGCAQIARLEPGATCQINVAFRPVSAGPKSTSFEVRYHNEAGNRALSGIQLKGTSLPGALLVADPVATDFGDTIVGLNVRRVFLLRNTGQDKAKQIVFSNFISGSPFTVSHNCGAVPFSLDAGAQCTFTINFAPTLVARWNQSLAFTYRSESNPNANDVLAVTVPVRGNGINPGRLALESTTLDFGRPKKGSVATKTVTLTNTGTAAINQITIRDLSAPYGVMPGSCVSIPFSLPANGSCELIFTLGTSVTGTQTDTFSFSYSDQVATQTLNVYATGFVGQPGALVMDTPNPLVFNPTVIGLTATSEVRFTNVGDYPVSIAQISNVVAPFQLEAGGCNPAVGPRASCFATARFTPTVTGTAASPARVAFADNTNGDQGVINFSFSGIGANPSSLTAYPTSLNLGTRLVDNVGIASAIVFSVHGTVGGGVRNLRPLLTNTGSEANFAIIGDSCSSVSRLNLGATCSITVDFKPKSPGAKQAMLRLTYDNEVASASVTPIAIQGDGITPAAVTLTPASYNFGAIVVGRDSSTVPFTLRNSGGDTANISALVLGTGFRVGATTCPTTSTFQLAPNSECLYHVLFRPPSYAAYSGSLSLRAVSARAVTYASPTNISSAISGRGVYPTTLALSRTALDFGKPLANTGVKTLPVTVTNSGDVPATGINVSGIAAPFSVRRGTCPAFPFDLAPAGSCNLEVAFDTAATGVSPQVFRLNFSNGLNSQEVGVTVTGSIGRVGSIAITPSNLVVASTPVGGSLRIPAAFVLTNPGDYDVDLQGTTIIWGDIAYSSNTARGLTLETGTCAKVRAKSTCTFGVSFAPTSVYSTVISANVLYRDTVNSPEPVSARFTLQLTSFNPGNIVASPVPLDFGARVIGTPKRTMGLTLVNNGQSPVRSLTFNLGVTDTNYIIESGSATTYCTNTLILNPGASCVLNISFNPQRAGLITNSLRGTFRNELGTVSLGAGGSGFELRGTGQRNATIVFSPASPLNIGSATSPIPFNSPQEREVTLTNEGDIDTASPFTIAVVGNTYSLVGGTCVGRSSLPHGGSCTLRFRLAATTPGALPYSLGVIFGQASGTSTSALTGTGYVAFPVPTSTFMVNGSVNDSQDVRFGTSVAVTWSSLNTTSCSVKSNGTALSGWTELIRPAPGRSLLLAAVGSYRLELICNGPGGTVTRAITVRALPGTTGWYNSAGVFCGTVCAANGLRNQLSPDGHYCASGEIVPPSAVATVVFSKCWPGSYNLPNGYCSTHGPSRGTPTGRNGVRYYDSRDTFCYGTEANGEHQPYDNDDTDVIKGCYCAP